MQETNNNKQPLVPKETSVRNSFGELVLAIRDWFWKMFDLQEGLDREGTIISIKNNKKMQGANAWMLGCSIMIASLGLDLNSPAVIIGAMLVSPLMSPILGIGLGVAINDKDTLFSALRHFGLAILIALFTSTLYFFITPFGQVTGEISSRTSPTFLDGMVAVFGGLAGIISTTRKDKSNAIPGVAIATALMPPLCVTGFGLAEMMELVFNHGEMSLEEYKQAINTVFGIIGGSFYLFFLNSFFIALTAYIIIRVMGFPLRSYVNEKEARRNRIITVLFSIVIILPSTWILYNIYTLQQDKQEVSNFINDYFPEACIKHELTPVSQDTNKLIVQLLGKRISEDSIDHYENILTSNYHLHRPVKLFPMQAELSMEDLKNSLKEQRQEVVTMLEAERKQAQQVVEERKQLSVELEMMKSDSARVSKGMQLAKEAFPNELQAISYSDNITEIKDTTHITQPPTFLVQWLRGKSTRSNNQRLEGILKVSTELDTFRVITY